MLLQLQAMYYRTWTAVQFIASGMRQVHLMYPPDEEYDPHQHLGKIN